MCITFPSGRRGDEWVSVGLPGRKRSWSRSDNCRHPSVVGPLPAFVHLRVAIIVPLITDRLNQVDRIHGRALICLRVISGDLAATDADVDNVSFFSFEIAATQFRTGTFDTCAAHIEGSNHALASTNNADTFATFTAAAFNVQVPTFATLATTETAS